MSTRSRIAIKNADGSYDSIYCHWDGYPEHTGKMLKDYYNDLDSAKRIIDLGDLSFLDKKLEPTGEHTFDKPEEGVTVAYGRDRGETGVDSVHSDDKESLAKLCDDSWAEYIYVWDNNKWNTYEPGDLLKESVKNVSKAILNNINKSSNKKNLKESVLSDEDKTVYLVDRSRGLIYRTETEPIYLNGFNSYIMWDLHLVAGSDNGQWYGPEHFDEEYQFYSFAQYLVQESLTEAAKANDFDLVTSDDHFDEIEIK